MTFRKMMEILILLEDETELLCSLECKKDEHNVSYLEEGENNERNYAYLQLKVVLKKEEIEFICTSFFTSEWTFERQVDILNHFAFSNAESKSNRVPRKYYLVNI